MSKRIKDWVEDNIWDNPWVCIAFNGFYAFLVFLVFVVWVVQRGIG